MQRSAKLIGDIVLSVGECTCATESSYNGTLFTSDTLGDFFPVNRTMPLLQRLSGLKYTDFQLRAERRKFISRINSAGAGADNNHIVIFH